MGGGPGRSNQTIKSKGKDKYHTIRTSHTNTNISSGPTFWAHVVPRMQMGPNP